jgi:hypothetical protein
MHCAQTARWRFRSAGDPTELEIHIALEVTVPEPDGADVGIDHAYGPDLREPLWDLLYSALNNGVHAGVAAEGLPLPAGGILVTVTDLQIVPSPEALSEQGVRCLAQVLSGCTQGLLTAVRLGLEALGTSTATTDPV